MEKGDIIDLTYYYTGNGNVEWRSDNEEIAKVDANGKVIARGAGETFIYASTNNGSKAKCKVMVNQNNISLKSVFTVQSESGLLWKAVGQNIELADNNLCAENYFRTENPTAKVIFNDIINLNRMEVLGTDMFRLRKLHNGKYMIFTSDKFSDAVKDDKGTLKIVTADDKDISQHWTVNQSIIDEKIYINGEQLFKSPDFETGFDIKGLSTITDGSKVYGSFDYGQNLEEHDWQIAQWWSGNDINKDGQRGITENGLYYIEDSTKKVSVNPNEGFLSLKANTTDLYKNGYPSQENPYWLHLLADQGLTENDISSETEMSKRNLSNIKELYFTGDFRMSYFSSEYPGTGAAQYIVFINIQNLNKESEDYGKLMHFGVQIFDSRYEVVPHYEAADFAYVNGNFIYSLSSDLYIDKTFFKDGRPFGEENSDWRNVRINVYPYMIDAFEKAQAKGYFQNSSIDDLYVSAYTIGWEIPGIFECEMQLKNLGLYSIN